MGYGSIHFDSISNRHEEGESFAGDTDYGLVGGLALGMGRTGEIQGGHIEYGVPGVDTQPSPGILPEPKTEDGYRQSDARTAYQPGIS